MKRYLMICGFIILINKWIGDAHINADNGSKSVSIQSIKCEMTFNEIQNTFKRKLFNSKVFPNQYYIYNVRIVNVKSYAFIYFTNGKVSSITYRISPLEQSSEKQIELWLEIDKVLNNEYGKPELDQIKYINTQTRVANTTFSYDLSIGNIKLEKVWLTEHLWIQHELYKVKKNKDIQYPSYGHYLSFVCKVKKSD